VLESRRHKPRACRLPRGRGLSVASPSDGHLGGSARCSGSTATIRCDGLPTRRVKGTATTEDVTDRLAMEPLSPELVLVDPELARFARDRLPDPGQNPFLLTHDDRERSVARPLTPIAAGEISTGGIATQGPKQGERLSRVADRAATTGSWESEARASTRVRWRNGLLLTVGLVLAAAAFFALTPTRTGRELTPAQVPSEVRNAADTRSNTLARERREANRAARPAPKASAHPTQRARAKKHAQAGPKKHARAGLKKHAQAGPKKHPQAGPKKLAKPSRPSAFGTRLFVWPAKEDATLYKVAFFRHGKEVFEGLRLEPRLKLPLRWVYEGRHLRLTSGAYSWTVWPAFGPRTQLRYGKPIVQSTWVARR
jgi:hypothetical protein